MGGLKEVIINYKQLMCVNTENVTKLLHNSICLILCTTQCIIQHGSYVGKFKGKEAEGTHTSPVEK